MKRKQMVEAEVTKEEWASAGEEMARLFTAGEGERPDCDALEFVVQEFEAEYGSAFSQESFIQGWECGVSGY